MIGLARRLKEAGVLGINGRGVEFMLPNNDRKLHPLVDDKILTKKIALEAGSAVPDLYGVIETLRDIRKFEYMVEGHDDFVVKPAHGSQGHGIVIITEKSGDYYRKSDGVPISVGEIGFHMSNILSGIFSLGGQLDKVMIEYRVKFDPVFERIAFQGIPDVRIIVFFGVPAMAMVRLPTRMSCGKANLHLGAIGAGIDLATGKTLTAVWGNSIVTEHPDTGHPVSGVEIPQWQLLLDIAARSYEMTGLGYQGIDLVLDKQRGPLILELNARPGLNIQIANRAGLVPRLEKILDAHKALKSIKERVSFAQESFAA